MSESVKPSDREAGTSEDYNRHNQANAEWRSTLEGMKQ